MKLADYTQANFLEHSATGGDIRLQVGPFAVRLDTQVASFATVFYQFYAAYPLIDASVIADFFVSIQRPRSLRRWWRPQALFSSDDRGPFVPFPLDTAFPMYEWGLNWCIYTRANQYLMLHAAVLEKNSRAVVLPAVPGSGKSTLCAALCHRGWRLFSDEFALVSPEDGAIWPVPRPISLKNESIEVIRDFAPAAMIGPSFPKTRKGTVAHVQAPDNSVARMNEPAQPAWVIFPRFQPDSVTDLQPLSRSRAALRLGGNSFNYEIMGANGFRMVNDVVRQSACYTLHYPDLEQAVVILDQLAATD